MADKKGYSRPGLFGGTVHYDENGRKTGTSWPGVFGGTNHYDQEGNKVGTSWPGLMGGTRHYDSEGKKIGSSWPGLLFGTNTYDKQGNKVQKSYPSVFSDITITQMEDSPVNDALGMGSAAEENKARQSVPPPGMFDAADSPLPRPRAKERHKNSWLSNVERALLKYFFIALGLITVYFILRAILGI